MAATLEPGQWRRTDLVDRLAATLRLAGEALPLITTQTAEEAKSERSFFVRAKFVCETALVLRAASKVGEPKILGEPIAVLASAVAGIARDEHTLTIMRLRPNTLPELSVAHLCLTGVGLPDAAFDAEVRAIAAGSSLGLPERLPWKDVEAAWHRRIGAPIARLTPRRALERTAISQQQDVLFARREDVYSFTHGLIYATDFGHRPGPLPRPVADLTDDADAAVSRCLDDDDFDLGAEVLLSWPYTRAPWSATATFAFHVLAGVQDQVGILPSMTLRYDEFAKQDRTDQRRYFFKEAYHTVYVMGLLLAGALLDGAAPPARLRTADERITAVARSLYHLFPRIERTPQWQRHFDDLESAQQGALVSLLADIAVRRAIKGADFSLLSQVLSTFVNADTAPSSAVVQASQLLDRLAGRL